MARILPKWKKRHDEDCRRYGRPGELSQGAPLARVAASTPSVFPWRTGLPATESLQLVATAECPGRWHFEQTPSLVLGLPGWEGVVGRPRGPEPASRPQTIFAMAYYYGGT